MDTIKFEAKGIPDNSGRPSIWELGAVLLLLVSLFVWPPVSIAYAAPPTQEDFNLRKAFLIANACEITYLEDKKVLNTIKEMGIDVFDSADSASSAGTEDTHVFMASTDHYTLICFRGTQSAKNWATNFSTQQAPFSFNDYTNFLAPREKTGNVHSGFLRAWRDVKPKVIKYLAERGAPPDDPDGSRGKHCHDVLLGGHSLGGAVAILAGIELADLRYNVIGIFTFGGPRAVAKDFRVIYDEYASGPDAVRRRFPKIQRYVYKNDLVPELPPGYEHLGAEKYSAQMGTLSENVRSWWRWVTSATVNLDAVADHSMTNYVKTISTIVTKNAGDETTRAMAAWLSHRNKPLVSYLGEGIKKREATTTLVGFTDSRTRYDCN